MYERRRGGGRIDRGRVEGGMEGERGREKRDKEREG